MKVMPYREVPCETGVTYHIFNRSVAKQVIFTQDRDYKRFFDLVDYYRYERPTVRFSEYNRLTVQAKQIYLQRMTSTQKTKITLLAFCYMPNHFHLLIRQEIDDGIAQFVSIVQNGYAKYFNVKTKRHGALFQSMFKAVSIDTDEQLLHVARYIHLNPFTSGLLGSKELLRLYPWSSLGHYLNPNMETVIEKKQLLSYFTDASSLFKYTLDQAAYQRLLHRESHLYHDIGE